MYGYDIDIIYVIYVSCVIEVFIYVNYMFLHVCIVYVTYV